MRLLIVSHTPHYQSDGRIVGWGPTVRELNYLAELFEEVVHVATLYPGAAPASALPYSAPSVRTRLVAPAGGSSLPDKARILTAYPSYARVIRDELKRADAVHVRCPANISLLALALLRREKRPAYRWVKYAGNWQPDGGEAWSYGVQRRWLNENRHRGVVTVNGQWEGQPAHVRSFYNPCLTDEEAAEGRVIADAKQLSSPVELLFVGELNEGKGVGRALRVAHVLQQGGVSLRLRLLGDGPDRPRYEAWVREKGLGGVSFMGWVPRTEIARYYAAAHFILLPSRSEGWPKVLSEAMAYGAVPVAAAVSSIPQILRAAGAGVAIPVEDTDGMAAAISHWVANPEAWCMTSRAGVQAARWFTYSAYQEAVAGLFADSWGIRLPLPAHRRVSPALGVEQSATNETSASYSSNGTHR